MTNFVEANYSFSNAKFANIYVSKINLLKLQSYLDNRQQRVNSNKSYGSRGIIITDSLCFYSTSFFIQYISQYFLSPRFRLSLK